LRPRGRGTILFLEKPRPRQFRRRPPLKADSLGCGSEHHATMDILYLQSPTGDVALAPSCLLVALDETGHEELADPQYPVFGLGGCACLVQDYDALIRSPWVALKATCFGSPTEPIHAAGLRPSPEQAAAIGAFFRSKPFARIAALLTDRTALAVPLTKYEVTALTLTNRLREIAQHIPFTSLAFVFEGSDRTSALVERAFSTLEVRVGRPDGVRNIPLHFFWGGKALAEPALEVADFIMHAAGGAVRAHRAHHTPFLDRRDFRAVFGDLPEHLVSFLLVNDISLARRKGAT